MTEAEIMKALECCAEQRPCQECPLCNYTQDAEKCKNKVFVECLDLLNRKNAEIERVTKERDNITKTYTEVVDAWQITRAEAIKEFAERVKGKQYLDGVYVVDVKDIDQIAKEMGVEL